MHPQHDRSLNSGIDILYDSKEQKESPRKQHRSLSLPPLNSSDWNDYWETKTSHLMNTELPNKRI